MAWRCSAKSNSGLVDNLFCKSRRPYSSGLISSPRVYQAFLETDRGYFTPSQPYMDSPQVIGYGATISAPHMHAHAIENLEGFLQPGAKVLDVGCGSGYLVSILHALVRPSGLVVGIDHIPQLTSLARTNLVKATSTSSALDSGSIKLVTADGRRGAPPDVFPSEGFDCIHVGAASPVWPTELVKQLKSPGRMFVPVGEDEQEVIQIDKDRNGEVSSQKLFGVRYIPLTDRDKQWKS